MSSRRGILAGAVGAALAELGIGRATADSHSGQCGPCVNDHQCDPGLICFGGVCGPVDAACGSALWQCTARARLTCVSGQGICLRRRGPRKLRRRLASPLCK